jgi:hypothetical protein
MMTESNDGNFEADEEEGCYENNEYYKIMGKILITEERGMSKSGALRRRNKIKF